jgi:hypothetical protein
MVVGRLLEEVAKPDAAERYNGAWNREFPALLLTVRDTVSMPSDWSPCQVWHSLLDARGF